MIDFYSFRAKNINPESITILKNILSAKFFSFETPNHKESIPLEVIIEIFQKNEIDHHKAVTALFETLSENDFLKVMEFFEQKKILSSTKSEAKEENTPFHWLRLKESLKKKHGVQHERRITDLDSESERVISYLLRERNKNFKIIKGLVIGHVQSGKTENMMAVSAKALDNGYKIVIVLSGILNSLRSQTQKRFDEDWTKNKRTLAILGIDDDYIKGNKEPGNILDVITFAGEKDDEGEFNRNNRLPEYITCATQFAKSTSSLVLIIKKNTKVLQSLKDALKDVGAHSNNKIKFPTLIIDDESDQATINTKKSKSEISTINNHARDLINDYFDDVTYIGYTATPYANFFIDKNDKDLYPENFITCLSKKDGYIGAEEMYGNSEEEISGIDIFNFIDEDELTSVRTGKIKYITNQISGAEGLEEAIINFLISICYCEERERDRPFSFLIHASMRTSISQLIQGITTSFLEYLKLHIGEGRALDERISKLNLSFYRNSVRIRENLSQSLIRHIEAFSIKHIPDEIIINRISKIIGNIKVTGMHQNSKDTLNFKKHPMQIVVGGNKLSRGLSLDGLIGAYFARESNGYDTIMQMGRWFGYRAQYIDLMRLYCSPDSYQDFESIVEVEIDLRKQVKDLELLDFSPKDYPPSIIKIAGINIVAKNRMGASSVQYEYLKPKKAFSDISFEIAKTFKKHNEDIIALLKIKNFKFKSVGNRQLYYCEIKNFGNWFNILKTSLSKDMQKRFTSALDEICKNIIDESNNNRFILFLRGSAESASPVRIDYKNEINDFIIKPGRRQISPNGKSIKNVIAPQDYKDIENDINDKDHSKIFYIGFYYIDIPETIKKTDRTFSELSLLENLDTSNRAYLVPTINIPVTIDSYERWGQDHKIDEQDDIIGDD
jgi:hypothetical protein